MWWIWCGCCLLFPIASYPASQHPSSEEPSELSLFEDIPTVVTASKKNERITEAPSIISVITEKEIRRMGAQTLADVLRTIPGIEIITDAYHLSQIAVRGLYSETSAGVKIFVDGHAINDPLTGGATEFYDHFPLHNVRRIEIIRGPASSIYGANAFVSVINILTKDPEDLNGTDVTVSAGSFNTLNAAIQTGRIMNDLGVMLTADYYHTDGAQLFINADTMTLYDELTQGQFGRFSLAPGDFQDTRDCLDLSLKLKYHDVLLQGGFRDQRRGSFLTDVYVLNNDSTEDVRHAYSALSYRRFVTERLEIGGKVYGDYFLGERFEQFAAGLSLPIPPDYTDLFVYSDGLIARMHGTGWRIGAEAQASYRLYHSNDLTLGIAYEYQGVKDFHVSTNQENYTLGLPADALVDLAALNPGLRTSWDQYAASVFAQDIWKIRHDLDAILGVRGDYFNDFGGVVTPKIGLLYQPLAKWNFKALLGTSFRVPSFLEIYANEDTEDPFGEENLVVESLGAFEVGVGYQPFDWLVGEMNIFYTEIRKLAEATSLSKEDEESLAYPVESTQIYRSVGGIDVQGVEFELRGDSERELNLRFLPRVVGTWFRLNYSYQYPQDSITHEDVPERAHHKGNFGMGVHLSAAQSKTGIPNILGLFRSFSDEFTLYSNLFVCGPRKRSISDLRDDLPLVALLDLTLTAHDIFRRGLGLSVSMKNVFDTDYRAPSPAFSAEDSFSLARDDYPYPGRSVFVELRYTF